MIRLLLPIVVLLSAQQSFAELEYLKELVYPKKLISQDVGAKTEFFEFLGKKVSKKVFAIDLALEVWGFSENASWSYVYNNQEKKLYILFFGKSQFIRDPVRHDLQETIIIGEPSKAPKDWHKDWEVFVSLEKEEGCKFHDPASFTCFNWVSLGKY